MSEGQEVIDMRIELDLVSVGKLASWIEARGGRLVWCRIVQGNEQQTMEVGKDE